MPGCAWMTAMTSSAVKRRGSSDGAFESAYEEAGEAARGVAPELFFNARGSRPVLVFFRTDPSSSDMRRLDWGDVASLAREGGLESASEEGPDGSRDCRLSARWLVSMS